MRKAREIHQHLRTYLNHVFQRPAMYAPGLGSEALVYSTLHHLAFIESREQDLASLMAHWKECGAFHSNTGIPGAFWKRLGGKIQDHSDRVLSVYAEAAFHMGYLDTRRQLSRSEKKALSSGLEKRVRQGNWSRAEVKTSYGPPSFQLGPLDGYASESGYFHFFDYANLRPDAKLLMVRRPARKFSSSILVAPEFTQHCGNE
jgi:hypothetical protein